MKDELGGQIIKKFVGLCPKSYSYLKGNDDECKKAKGTKKCVVKRTLKFEYYKKCLKVSQIINIVNCLEKKGINFHSLKKDLKVKGVMSITEEINKIALNSIDDKLMQSIDSVETNPHGMDKHLILKKEKVKRINIIKQYKNV